MNEPIQAVVNQAIAAMLDEFRGNDWMLNEHWPLNEPHVRMMIADVMARFPPGPQARVLDVGCFNGYISFLFRQLGYQVTGTDVCELEDRETIFAKAGIGFEFSNLNDAEPFNHFAAEQFDVVIYRAGYRTHFESPVGLNPQPGPHYAPRRDDDPDHAQSRDDHECRACAARAFAALGHGRLHRSSEVCEQ